MKISLTFDNGPHPLVTPYVLKLLKAHDVKATFFHVCRNLEAPEAADLLAQIQADAHPIGNHSYTHTVPLGQCAADVAVEEIDAAQRKFAEFDIRPTLFRPFGGGGNLDRNLMHPKALEYLQANGMTCVLWNCVPRDWVDPKGWCDRALADIEERDWSVVVIHDLENRGMEDVPRFIDQARAKGAEFVLSFPDDCAPVREGRLMWDMSHLMPAQP